MNTSGPTISLFLIAQICFAIAGGLALIAAGLKLFAPDRSRLGFRLALAGALLGLFQFLFALFVQLNREEDSGPKIAEGPPLWFILLVPALPLIINAALAVAHRRQLK